MSATPPWTRPLGRVGASRPPRRRCRLAWRPPWPRPPPHPSGPATNVRAPRPLLQSGHEAGNRASSPAATLTVAELCRAPLPRRDLGAAAVGESDAVYEGGAAGGPGGQYEPVLQVPGAAGDTRAWAGQGLPAGPARIRRGGAAGADADRQAGAGGEVGAPGGPVPGDHRLRVEDPGDERPGGAVAGQAYPVDDQRHAVGLRVLDDGPHGAGRDRAVASRGLAVRRRLLAVGRRAGSRTTSSRVCRVGGRIVPGRR